MALIKAGGIDTETQTHSNDIEVRLPDDTLMGHVYACDPAEGRLDVFIIAVTAFRPRTLRDAKKRELATASIHTDFDVFNKRTRELLHRVRWSFGNPCELRHEVRPKK